MPEKPDAVDLESLLTQSRNGNEQALKEVFAAVYDELRKSAKIQLAKQEHCSLQATELVNVAYSRIIKQRKLDPANRAQFLGIAAIVIKRKLLDHLRARRALRRGGDQIPVTLDSRVPAVQNLALDSRMPAVQKKTVDLGAIDRALEQLRVLSPRQAKVVELRYFAGRSIDQTAKEIGKSPATVKTDWAAARAFLWSQLNDTLGDS